MIYSFFFVSGLSQVFFYSPRTMVWISADHALYIMQHPENFPMDPVKPKQRVSKKKRQEHCCLPLIYCERWPTSHDPSFHSKPHPVFVGVFLANQVPKSGAKNPVYWLLRHFISQDEAVIHVYKYIGYKDWNSVGIFCEGIKTWIGPIPLRLKHQE